MRARTMLVLPVRLGPCVSGRRMDQRRELQSRSESRLLSPRQREHLPGLPHREGTAVSPCRELAERGTTLVFYLQEVIQ
jgi:hypothetical protein